MTERSYLWDGTATGDASLAPYSAEEFLKYFTLIRSDNNEGVIPGYLGSLESSFAGDNLAAVYVKAGAAIVDGRLYVLDEDITIPISVPSTSLGSRLDYLVLRTTGSKVALTIVEGAPALLTPSAPTINATDVPIAIVYVDTQVADGYVYDRRPFLTNVYSDSIESHQNLIKNSEYMVSSQPPGNPPEWWVETDDHISGSPWWVTISTYLPYYFSGTRGNVIAMRAEDAVLGETFVAGIQQVIQAGGGRVFTLKGDIYLTSSAFPSGPAHPPIVVTLAGYNEYGSLVGYKRETYKQEVEPPSSFFFPLRFTTEFAEDISSLAVTIEVYGLYDSVYGNAAEAFAGQFILTAGYNTGKAAEEQELIVVREPYTDAGWTLTNKSDATTTLDLDSNYLGYIPDGVYAVILRITIRDTASGAAVNNWLRVLTMDDLDVGTLFIAGEPNSSNRSANVIVPVDEARQFKIEVNATGAATLTATVAVVGVLL